MTAGEESWCGKCHHMIIWSPADNRWMHHSEDDWSGPLSENVGWGDCGCFNQLIQCVPESSRPRSGWTRIGRTSATSVTLASGMQLNFGPGDLYRLEQYVREGKVPRRRLGS